MQYNTSLTARLCSILCGFTATLEIAVMRVAYRGARKVAEIKLGRHEIRPCRIKLSASGRELSSGCSADDHSKLDLLLFLNAGRVISQGLPNYPIRGCPTAWKRT
jgi:hypothetical protein